MSETKIKLYQKLFNVLNEMDYIQKDKTVGKGTKSAYNYASEKAIKERFHQALVKNRLLFLPKAANITGHYEVAGKDWNGNDKIETITEIKAVWRYVDVDSGEFEEVESIGAGNGADKATYKAITGALKYAVTSSFVIPTGDDPEKEETPPQTEGRPHQQAAAERKMKERETPKPESDPVERMHREKMQASGYGEPAPQPTWIDRPAAASKATSAIPDAVLKMWERMNTIEARLAIFQQHKYELTQACGKEEGEKRYYEKLSPYKHANEVAKDAMKSRKIAKELWETIQNYKRPVNAEITEEDIPA